MPLADGVFAVSLKKRPLEKSGSKDFVPLLKPSPGGAVRGDGWAQVTAQS
jgi:hypothetical protein